MPWEDTPRDIKDELIDILAVVPELFYHLDAYASCQNTSQAAQGRQFVLQKCWTLDSALQKWHLKLLTMLDQPNPTSSRISEGRNELNPHDFKTCGFGAAYLILLYWGICIMVYSTLRTVVRQIGEPLGVPLPARTDPGLYAIKITQSVDYFFAQDAGLVGMQYVIFPLGVALQHLIATRATDTQAWRKATRVFDQEGVGSSLGKFLKNHLTIVSLMSTLKQDSSDHP